MGSTELFNALNEKGYKVGYEDGVVTAYLNEKEWKKKTKLVNFIDKELKYIGSWGMKLQKEEALC